MKPLIVLLVVFAISTLSTKLFLGGYNLPLSARIGMCAMLIFTAIGHFAFTKGMSLMLPANIPLKTTIVYLTGVLEIILGVGLLIPILTDYSAWLLILFFVCILPANIHAAIKQVDYQKGTFNGNGLSYLWFRVPLQLVFILWTYFCVIKF